MGDTSRLDLFDEDAVTAASCSIQSDHTEAQTAGQRASQTDQLRVTALHAHTRTHVDIHALLRVLLCMCCGPTHLRSGENPFLERVR